jgi:hypothetical protein
VSLAAEPPRRRFRFRWYHLLWIAAPVLLAIALRGVPLRSIAQVLARLTYGQVALIASVNLAALLIFSGRWSLILKGFGFAQPLLDLVAYRTAGFSISYFTPGTQFGGEPLQILLLTKRKAVPLPFAAASVTIDKALELLGNFTFLAFGILISTQTRVLPGLSARPLLVAALAVLALPLALVIAASRGVRPLTLLLDWMRQRWPSASHRLDRAYASISEMETHIVLFYRQHPLLLLAAMGFSLASWVVMVSETWLELHFLGISLGVVETIAIVTASRLAFLIPVPGGLGALEAGLTLALTALGRTPAEALALSAVIRARDLLVGGSGLILAAILPRDRGGTPSPAA